MPTSFTFTVIWPMLLIAFVLSGCSTASSQKGESTIELSNLAEADAQAYKTFPEALGARARSAIPVDNTGLIGRNRQWGALYSPRFQLGAGAALRTALAAGRPIEANRAFHAIEVAVESIHPDGYIPSSVPNEVSGGAEPSAADISSGAAFFLGDACLGVLALESTGRANAIVDPERRTVLRGRLVTALGWLLTQADLLMQVDRAAPNRLLFDARSFQACGALASDNSLLTQAESAVETFVRAALALQAADGHFIEGGGHDTSYQGVALLVGEDVILAGYDDANGELSSSLTSAAEWLAGRVSADGRINSSGNQRTCEGGETFLGELKQVSVPEVFAGLVYAGVRTGRDSFTEAAQRIENWVRANPNTDPCYS